MSTKQCIVVFLIIMAVVFFLLSKGYCRWSWYYGQIDCENDLIPSYSNLGYYVNKYDLNSKLSKHIVELLDCLLERIVFIGYMLWNHGQKMETLISWF